MAGIHCTKKHFRPYGHFFKPVPALFIKLNMFANFLKTEDLTQKPFRRSYVYMILTPCGRIYHGLNKNN